VNHPRDWSSALLFALEGIALLILGGCAALVLMVLIR